MVRENVSNNKKRTTNTNRNLTAVRMKTIPEKPPSDAVQKHSAPIYISRSLFNNKRLKQKRLRLQEMIEKAPTIGHTNQRKKKTERRIKTVLQSDITIDLLTDNENDDNDDVQKTELPMPMPQQAMQHFSVYQNQTGQSDLPHITLVRITKKQCDKYIKKRLAKNRQPEPTFNQESIVLTDDDDDDDKSNNSDGTQINSSRYTKRLQASTPNKPPHLSTSALHSAQVDEEVTVSLVPRSSTAGTCRALNADEPTAGGINTSEHDGDETTVHTVIANQSYSFTLTKLREGLASGSVANFNNKGQPGQPKKASIKAQRPPATPPPAPILLKLSSELSISLISDDDDDNDANAKDMAAQDQLSAQKMLQRQRHLSVQQVPLPIPATQSRRRKLN